MICGLDTNGGVYLSLLQANSNSGVMGIFFRHLVRQLDKERPDWRSNTLVQLDNASYHTSPATLKLLEGL